MQVGAGTLNNSCEAILPYETNNNTTQDYIQTTK